MTPQSAYTYQIGLLVDVLDSMLMIQFKDGYCKKLKVNEIKSVDYDIKKIKTEYSLLDPLHNEKSRDTLLRAIRNIYQPSTLNLPLNDYVKWLEGTRDWLEEEVII
jgi:hypothetical protein